MRSPSAPERAGRRSGGRPRDPRPGRAAPPRAALRSLTSLLRTMPRARRRPIPTSARSNSAAPARLTSILPPPDPDPDIATAAPGPPPRAPARAARPAYISQRATREPPVAKQDGPLLVSGACRGRAAAPVRAAPPPPSPPARSCAVRSCRSGCPRHPAEGEAVGGARGRQAGRPGPARPGPAYLGDQPEAQPGQRPQEGPEVREAARHLGHQQRPPAAQRKSASARPAASGSPPPAVPPPLTRLAGRGEPLAGSRAGWCPSAPGRRRPRPRRRPLAAPAGDQNTCPTRRRGRGGRGVGGSPAGWPAYLGHVADGHPRVQGRQVEAVHPVGQATSQGAIPTAKVGYNQGGRSVGRRGPVRTGGTAPPRPPQPGPEFVPGEA